MNTSVNIAGVTLKNPVVTASGTFGNGWENGQYFDLSELGAVCVKAITLKPKAGNDSPRIAEVTAGILNSVGLQNPGIEHFMQYDIPYLKKFDTKIIANISGSTVEENCEIAEILGDSVDLIELNISCPNVKHGGVAFGTRCDSVSEITGAVKKHCKVPLIVKLSPNVTDITEIARAAGTAGADALSLINTLFGMKIDINTRRPVLANNAGGFSGPAVKPVAVRMVWQVKKAVSVPIIGMGGIMSGEDAAEFMIAGAAAVAVGTASLINPDAALTVKNGLENYMKIHGIDDVNTLTGSIIEN